MSEVILMCGPPGAEVSQHSHFKRIPRKRSFWSRSMRDGYRRLLGPFGVIPKIVYVVTPREVALRRVRDRDNSAPNDVQLSDLLATQYHDAFEPPTAAEGPIQVVSGA